MASVIKGKVKVLPSGLTSVLLSHVPSASSSSPPLTCLSCQSSAELQGNDSLPDEDKHTDESAEETGEVFLTPGKGGLGNKVKASWKTCRNASERMSAAEIEFGKGNIWFMTLTQPSTDPLAFEALARWSSYAVDRLNRVLNRYFGEREFARVSVWEYQERGSLHLHVMLASDCIHAMNREEFRMHIGKKWYQILGDVCNKFNAKAYRSSWGHDWEFQELMEIDDGEHFINCQTVEYSVAAYLSTYLADSNHKKDGKGKQGLREKFWPIATWMQWNKCATELFNKHLDEFDLGVCEPDKIPQLKAKIEALKDAMYCKKDTEPKPPKNPFNHGFYLIPDPTKISENACLLAEFVGSVSYHFREDLFKESPTSDDPSTYDPYEDSFEYRRDRLKFCVWMWPPKSPAIRRRDEVLTIRHRASLAWLLKVSDLVNIEPSDKNPTYLQLEIPCLNQSTLPESLP